MELTSGSENSSTAADKPPVVLSISTAATALGFSIIGLVLLSVGVLGHRPRVFLAIGGILFAVGLIFMAKTPRAALRRSLANFGLFFVSLIICLMLCEVGARIFFRLRGIDIHGYQPSFIYSYVNERQFDRRRFISHPFLPFAPRPLDARVLYIDRAGTGQPIRYDYSQNSLGLRSPERPFAKPDKTLRIVTLGGSTTWDGPTNDQTWPAMLERKLNDHYRSTGYRIEAINLAADAYSSPMSLVSLALLGVNFHPDLVISYDGINDLMLEGYEGLEPDYRTVMSRFDDHFQTLQSRLPNVVFKSYLISIASRQFDRLQGGNPDVLRQVVFNQRKHLNPSNDAIAGVEYFERNLRLMRAIATESNAKFLASTAHWVSPQPNQVTQNTRLREFFNQTHINYVDVDALLGHNDWSLHVDQVHWTSKGLDVLSDEWMKKIVADDLLGLNAKPSSK